MMRRVLIVDRDKYTRVKFSLLLKDCECEIDSVETFPEAIKRMRREAVDCIIMDVENLGAERYAVIPVIHAVSPDTEVIATTSENSRELETRTREQGVFYYYIKSFDADELKQAVKSAFGKHETKARDDYFLEKQKKTEEE